MSKKKKKSGGFFTGLITIIIVGALAFGAYKFLSVRLFGTYKYEATGSGLGITITAGTGTYTFSGINTVVHETTITLIGTSTTTQTGTYKINEDNTITFTFPEEVKKDDGTTETVMKSTDYEFYKGNDTIKIGGIEYKKQK